LRSNPTRRELLAWAAGGIALSGFALTGCRSEETIELADVLRPLVDSPDSFLEIGQLVLEENPTMDLDSLTAELKAAVEWSEAMSEQELGMRLADRVRGDYREGRTLPVGNWILSETEARWAALQVLSAPVA